MGIVEYMAWLINIGDLRACDIVLFHRIFKVHNYIINWVYCLHRGFYLEQILIHQDMESLHQTFLKMHSRFHKHLPHFCIFEISNNVKLVQRTTPTWIVL